MTRGVRDGIIEYLFTRDRYCVLNGVLFDEADLTNANLNGSTLVGAKLSYLPLLIPVLLYFVLFVLCRCILFCCFLID